MLTSSAVATPAVGKAQQLHPPRPNNYPKSSTAQRRRRQATFVERLLRDPVFQTMADIGKQESAIAPLPTPSSRNIVWEQEWNRSKI